MKKLITLIIFMLAIPAFAWDIEASVGSTQFQKPDNGIWWQNPFENTFDLQSPSYSIGVSGYVYPSVRGRVAYTRLGNVTGYAIATPQDAQYNGVDGCVGPCPVMSAFRTEGSVRGVSFTLAPEWNVSPGVKVFLEGGAFVYLPKFKADVGSCTTPACAPTWFNEYREGWQVGPQIGGGVEIDKVQLVFTLYKIDTPTPDINATTNFKSWAANVSLRYRF